MGTIEDVMTKPEVANNVVKVVSTIQENDAKKSENDLKHKNAQEKIALSNLAALVTAKSMQTKQEDDQRIKSEKENGGGIGYTNPQEIANQVNKAWPTSEVVGTGAQRGVPNGVSADNLVDGLNQQVVSRPHSTTQNIRDAITPEGNLESNVSQAEPVAPVAPFGNVIDTPQPGFSGTDFAKELNTEAALKLPPEYFGIRVDSETENMTRKETRKRFLNLGTPGAVYSLITGKPLTVDFSVTQNVSPAELDALRLDVFAKIQSAREQDFKMKAARAELFKVTQEGIAQFADPIRDSSGNLTAYGNVKGEELKLIYRAVQGDPEATAQLNAKMANGEIGTTVEEKRFYHRMAVQSNVAANRASEAADRAKKVQADIETERKRVGLAQAQLDFGESILEAEDKAKARKLERSEERNRGGDVQNLMGLNTIERPQFTFDAKLVSSIHTDLGISIDKNNTSAVDLGISALARENANGNIVTITSESPKDGIHEIPMHTLVTKANAIFSGVNNFIGESTGAKRVIDIRETIAPKINEFNEMSNGLLTIQESAIYVDAITNMPATNADGNPLNHDSPQLAETIEDEDSPLKGHSKYKLVTKFNFLVDKDIHPSLKTIINTFADNLQHAFTITQEENTGKYQSIFSADLSRRNMVFHPTIQEVKDADLGGGFADEAALAKEIEFFDAQSNELREFENQLRRDRDAGLLTADEFFKKRIEIDRLWSALSSTRVPFMKETGYRIGQAGEAISDTASQFTDFVRSKLASPVPNAEDFQRGPVQNRNTPASRRAALNTNVTKLKAEIKAAGERNKKLQREAERQDESPGARLRRQLKEKGEFPYERN